jgi:type IV secretion system protein VirB1
MSAIFSLAVIMQMAGTPACTAAGVPPADVAAIARTESGFHPYAIRDETTNRSLFPETADAAEAIARDLTSKGHLLGVGLMQLTPPSNFGLSIREALDPCRNMKAGTDFFASLSRYNSGSPTRSQGYAMRVVAESRRLQRAAAASPRSHEPQPKPGAPTACGPSWDVWVRCPPPTGAPAIEAAADTPVSVAASKGDEGHEGQEGHDDR